MSRGAGGVGAGSDWVTGRGPCCAGGVSTLAGEEDDGVAGDGSSGGGGGGGGTDQRPCAVAQRDTELASLCDTAAVSARPWSPHPTAAALRWSPAKAGKDTRGLWTDVCRQQQGSGEVRATRHGRAQLSSLPSGRTVLETNSCRAPGAPLTERAGVLLKGARCNLPAPHAYREEI